MQAYRVETVLQQDGRLTLSNLPLQAGASVEVIILVHGGLNRPSNVIGSGILKRGACYARSETHAHRFDGG